MDILVGMNLSSISKLSTEFESHNFRHDLVYSPGGYLGFSNHVDPSKKFSFQYGFMFSIRQVCDYTSYDFIYYPTYLRSIYTFRKINVTNLFYAMEFPLKINFAISQKMSLSAGIVPALLFANCKGTIIDSVGSPTPKETLINGGTSGINSFSLDSKFSLNYSVTGQFRIELSFQRGLLHVFNNDEYSPYNGYASDYKDGIFNVFSLGIAHRLGKPNVKNTSP